MYLSNDVLYVSNYCMCILLCFCTCLCCIMCFSSGKEEWLMLITKRIIINLCKKTKLYKRVQPTKSLGENSCEIKGGGHKMAVMMWMIINANNGFVH